MMITEDYCHFEVSKLLSEKGFDETCQKKHKYTRSHQYSVKDWFQDECLSNAAEEITIPCPTLQMACQWVRKVYQCHITTKPCLSGDGHMYCYEIHKLGPDEITLIQSETKYAQPEEAAEAALLFTLTNLI